MKIRAQPLLALGFAGLLWFVGLQTFFPFITLGDPLRGVTKEPAAPTWGCLALRSGATFRAIDDWFSSHVGLRNFWVRLDNQITYSLFGETERRSEGTHVVAGPGDWLFEHHYITHAVHPGGPTEAELRQSMVRLRRVQDKLAAHGLPLLLLVAPSKVETYPEHVPAAYWGGRDPARVTTTFERGRPLLAAYGINFYDGPARFREWKQTLPDNLFTRSGTHWSYYSAYHVLNELRDRLNPVMRHPLPEFRLKALHNRKPLGADEDLLALINLLVDTPHRHPTPSPDLAAQTAVPVEKLPRILWVHDSFGWPLIELLYAANAARPSESLYYFQNAYAIPGGVKTDRDLAKINWETYLRDYDAVVLVWTEIAFDSMGWGFLEAVDQHLP
jgi:hypothetical protein